MLRRKKDTVLVIDDDPIFNKLISLVLKKFGLKSAVFSNTEDFLGAAKERLPDLFIVDLNIGTPRDGFKIVETLRKTLTKKVPILIVSGTTELSAVAMALDAGADDYLFKPINREMLVSKLSQFLDSDGLLDAKAELHSEGGGTFKGILQVDFRITAVDELGIKVVSKHMIAKGTVLKISGPSVFEITGKDNHVMLTAASTWTAKTVGFFGTYLEFDSEDEELSSHVRSWIVKRSRPRP